MRHIKKLAGIILALVLAISLTATAFAATVTISADTIITGHKFTAYQIFSGREDNGVLSDIAWGDGISSANFLAALKADTTYGNLFTACNNAADVANVLSDNNTNTALANQVAKLAENNKTGAGVDLATGANTMADGYYLIVDTTTDVGEGDAYNAALLQVVGNIDIAVKTDVPSVEKKVKEDDKYNQDGGYGAGYNDVADYNIGEEVPFHLIGRVPDMSRYDTYKYIFHDTLSAGLTPPAASGIKVYLSADKICDDNDTDITSNFSVDVTGQKITVSCDNIKVITGIAQGNYIIVEYSAVLNANAEIGLPGNLNTVKLEYSNKPDQSGSGDTDNTGETVEDKVIVFTYELETNKVDGQNPDTKLEGAKFVLLNADKSKVATVDINGKLTGWVDLPAEGADWAADSILTSDVNGLFTVAGLDDGTYYLREIEAPAGYNILTADVEVIITAETANGQDWTDGLAQNALTGLSATADGEPGARSRTVDIGYPSIIIANNSGSTLPETGGIGTTIFYIAGAALVVAAIVLLVTKRRMGKAEK
ncbi:MAG: isopeptide-forming domain-containing fimbrial protein [Clostridiales bacterium]|nr:isopeptide-forming domain-containing fimbrial protein [Clostridiales bacterium]